jgi:hypothetical protein
MRLNGLLLIGFLLSAACTNGSPKSVVNIEANMAAPGPAVDTLSIDTTGTQSMEKILGLKAGIIVMSCVVEFYRGGEIFKTVYSPGNFGKIWPLICRTRPRDRFYVSNIIVTEGDKRSKLADRTFFIK